MAYVTPNTAYYQQIQADIKSKTPTKAEEGTLGAIAAATAGLAGVQAANITQQIQNAVSQTALKNAYTTMLARYTLAQLGIKTAQLGVTKQAAQQKAALLGTTFGIEQKQFALGQQVYPEEYALAGLTYQNKIKGLQEQAATSGASNTVTQKRKLTTLQARYGFQLADIARAQATSILGQQATLAKQQYTAQQIANTEKNLQLLAQANGLSITEVRTRLNYAITQNQLAGVTSVNQLMTKLAGIWSGAQVQLGTKLSTGGFLAGGVNLLAPAQPAPVKSGGKIPTVTNINWTAG